MRSCSMRSWLVEVSWSDSNQQWAGAVGARQAFQSRFHHSDRCLPACRLHISTSKAERTDIAFFTVLGMSCSFKVQGKFCDHAV